MPRNLTTAEINAVESDLGERFREEAEKMDDHFVDFVLSRDGDEVLRPICLLLKGNTPDATLAAEDLRNRYVIAQLCTRDTERAEVERYYLEYGRVEA